MNNKIIYGIIYGTIILCILFTLLIGTSVLSTGYKIADFLLAVFLSAIGLYLIYKNIVDNKNLDNENIDKTLSGVKEMLEVKISYDAINSTFESSLSNMKKLENDIYLENYTEYKNKINDDLQNLLNTQTLDHNKNLLTGLINKNIYIQTINKYNDKYNDKNNKKIDENYDNINQLFNHFINYFIKMFNTNPVNYVSLYDNLIKDLTKLQEVILSMKDNDRYILQFNNLIKIAYKNIELSDFIILKTKLNELKINKTLTGNGEGDGMIMQEFINNHNKCYNIIETYLIGNTDEDKIDNYNKLITYIKESHNKVDNNTEGYYNNIEQYIKKSTPLDTFNKWKNTCITNNQ